MRNIRGNESSDAKKDSSRRPLQFRELGGRLFAEFDVPIGQIEEMLPAIVVLSAEIDLDERTPLRPLGLANEMHAGFGRSTVGFAGVTTNAGAHDVFPSGGAAAIAWHDVVEI